MAKYKDERSTGLILEVDLEYPKELHSMHKCYPLAPEQLEVSSNMLSDYCKRTQARFNMSSAPDKKLIPNLMD